MPIRAVGTLAAAAYLAAIAVAISGNLLFWPLLIVSAGLTAWALWMARAARGGTTMRAIVSQAFCKANGFALVHRAVEEVVLGIDGGGLLRLTVYATASATPPDLPPYWTTCDQALVTKSGRTIPLVGLGDDPASSIQSLVDQFHRLKSEATGLTPMK